MRTDSNGSNEEEVENRDVLDLGPCCGCEATGPTVRNVLTLPKRAPVPGTGWGCVLCGLPNDGAVAVLCDECMGPHPVGEPLKVEVRFACMGYAGEGRRIPIEELQGDFDHDRAKHHLVDFRGIPAMRQSKQGCNT